LTDFNSIEKDWARLVTALCNEPLRSSVLQTWKVQLMDTDRDAELAQNLSRAQEEPELETVLEVIFAKQSRAFKL
jgi:hypothetical protein